MWCRSYDCTDYDTDHNIVCCKVKLELKKQHESEGELKKQHESEGKLKKQHESEGELKKQHESEGELKKQHESEGELKKQHESEGDVSQHNIEPQLDQKPKKPDVDDVKKDDERKPWITLPKCFISLKVNAASKIEKRCHKRRETNYKRNVQLKHELWHGSTDHRQRQPKRAQRR